MTAGSIALKPNSQCSHFQIFHLNHSGFKPSLGDWYQGFFQEAKVPITFPCLILQKLVHLLKMNKIKKGENLAKEKQRPNHLSLAKLKRPKQGFFNRKCYATLIICHLPCKIQIKHEKNKILTWGYFIMQNILVLQHHHWNASWNYSSNSQWLPLYCGQRKQRIQTSKPHTSLQQPNHDRLVPTKTKQIPLSVIAELNISFCEGCLNSPP